MFQKLILSFFLVSSIVFGQGSGPYPNKEGGIGNTQGTTTSTPAKVGKDSNYSKSFPVNIAILEKEILIKLSDIEKLQQQASEFNKDLQKEIFLISENSVSGLGQAATITAKYVEYIFEAGKTKEIKVVNRQKILKNDLHSITRTLSYTPGNSESIKITVDKFETKVKGNSEVEAYKDLTKESKLQALKAIDSALYATIFRLDSFIQKNEISKLEKNRTLLEGL
jgi:hypothetical protein